jgi:hypothetical protein
LAAASPRPYPIFSLTEIFIRSGTIRVSRFSESGVTA